MANNPYVNKVNFGNDVVMDISDTTATEADVLPGKTFYKANGAQALGALANATQSKDGLMSSADKTKLDGIAEGATSNTGTITGINMNGVSKGTSGVVDLGTVLTEHQDVSGKQNKYESAEFQSIVLNAVGDANNLIMFRDDAAHPSTTDNSGGILYNKNNHRYTFRSKGLVNKKNVDWNLPIPADPSSNTRYDIYTSYDLTSKNAASGGSDVSLVTTGEKAKWNNITDLESDLDLYGLSQTQISINGLMDKIKSADENSIISFSLSSTASATLFGSTFTGTSIGFAKCGSDLARFVCFQPNYPRLFLGRIDYNAKTATVILEYDTTMIVGRRNIGTYTDATLFGVYGYITSGGTRASLSIPMVLVQSCQSVAFTKFLARIRSVDGTYLGGSNGVDLTSYITSASLSKAQGIIIVILDNANGWGITNNTPLSGEAVVTYTLS